MGELMFEFQTSDEEEDRKESIGCPVSDGQVQPDGIETDLGGAKLGIPIA
jgi:hypothetical protein